ncbi:MAG: hypothetical protein CMP59_09085 [Flavobacteriales bacterium]|mgnify:CR=1 FL=1|nr:hypothetical protein [Flavobacteriales bacterium]
MNTLKIGGFILLLSLICQDLTAQISISDNFNDSNLYAPIRWSGDTNKFIVNSNLQLQLNDTNPSSPSFLTCSSTIIDNSLWEFYIKLQFSPSSSNYAEVYLTSDQHDPSQAAEAYFLRIGGISGSSDDVSLYVRNANQNTELIDGIDGLAGGAIVEMKIRVRKDSNHLWELWIDENLNGNYISQGTAYDSSQSLSSYFSFWAKYTSSRSDKFFWDDLFISGFPFMDNEPIEIVDLEVIDSATLHLQLSELADPITALSSVNYRLLDNWQNPTKIDFETSDSSVLKLDFNPPFVSGQRNKLVVQGLKDRSGNQMLSDSLSFTYYSFNQPSFGDVRITELLADPIPSVALPEVEYVELLNTTSSYFNLQFWKFSDPSSEAELRDFVLAPNDYILLCEAEDSALLSGFGKVMGLENFPSLNNSEDHLFLRDSSGNLIDELNYKSSWHSDEIKRAGGWSLEMINPYLNCSGEENFSSSIDSRGGTAAAQNSVYNDDADTSAPFIIATELKASDHLILHFNEVLDSSQFHSYQFHFDTDDISANAMLKSDERSIEFNLNGSIDSGKVYLLECIGIYDCEGNMADTLIVEIILPFIPQLSEVILNEILFNPRSSGVDFVELYNRSDKVFSLDRLFIGNSVDTAEWEIVEASGVLFHPSELWVLTDDPSRLQMEYPNLRPNHLIEFDLPSFPNEEGQFYLGNQKKQLIEHFHYNEDMHFQLLSSFDGVSLERLDPFSEAVADNFFSASEQVNFATPTLPNSQRSPKANNAVIGFRDKVFSPDNDGFQDLLFLDYEFEQPGFVGTIEVLDSKGRRIKKLLNNELLSIEGTFLWDGIDDSGSNAPIGIYLLTFEAFHPSGELVFKKLPFVLAGMLD